MSVCDNVEPPGGTQTQRKLIKAKWTICWCSTRGARPKSCSSAGWSAGDDAMLGDDNDVWVIRLSANQAFGKQAMATTPLDTINTRRKHSGYNDMGVSTGPRGIGHLFWLQATTYARRDVCWSSFQRTLSGSVVGLLYNFGNVE